MTTTNEDHDLGTLTIPTPLDQGLEPHDKAMAEAILERAKQGRNTLVQAMIELWQHSDWIPLGYDNWLDLCDHGIGLRIEFTKADRVAAVEQMTQAGVSTRDQAAALMVGKSTVERDRQLSQNGPVEIIGADGKVREYPKPKTTAEFVAEVTSRGQVQDQESEPQEPLSKQGKAKLTRERTKITHRINELLAQIQGEYKLLLAELIKTDHFADVAEKVDQLEALKADHADAWAEVSDVASNKGRITEGKRLTKFVAEVRDADGLGETTKGIEDQHREGDQ